MISSQRLILLFVLINLIVATGLIIYKQPTEYDDRTLIEMIGIFEDTQAEFEEENTELGGIPTTDTSGEGKTFFVGDEGSELFFIFSKDGYETETIGISLSDESYTRTDALTVYLKETLSIQERDAILVFESPIYNKSLDINGTVIYDGSLTVSYNTDYRINSGLSAITVQEDEIGRYILPLTSGTDFSSLTSDNITVRLYLNGTQDQTYTIVYDGNTRTDLLTPISGLPTTRLNVLLLLVIIAIVAH